MKSLAVQIADSLAEKMETTAWTWANPEPGGEPEVGQYLIDLGIVPTAFVIPRVSASDVQATRILVAPRADGSEASTFDRCLRSRDFMIDVVVAKSIPETDANLLQPTTINQIDSLMALSDDVFSFVDANKVLGLANGKRSSLVELRANLYNPRELKESNVFYGSTIATYRVDQ